MSQTHSRGGEEQVLVLMPEGFRTPGEVNYKNMLGKLKFKIEDFDLKKTVSLSGIFICLLLLLSLSLIIILSSQPLCNKSLSAGDSSQADTFVLVSEGEVAEYQSTTLGIYDKVPYRLNGSPVYVQKGGRRFIYKGTGEWWYANGNFGAETGVLRTKSLNSTGLDWFYGTGGTWVSNDSTVEIVPLSSPLAHCLECQEININSSGAAKDVVPEFLGTFQVLKGIYMDGRPVYVNKNGKYFHKDGKATYGVRGKFTGDGVSVQSASGPVCAFLEKASKSERFGHGWRYWAGTDWEFDMTLGARCTKF